MKAPIHPDTPICRGCAGLGIGHHVSPRVIQLLNTVQGSGGVPSWKLVWPTNRLLGGHNKQDRYVGVAVWTLRERCVFRGPYALALAEYRRHREAGFILDPHEDQLEPQEEWTCRWCHGTGQPALSVGTMQRALVAAGHVG